MHPIKTPGIRLRVCPGDKRRQSPHSPPVRLPLLFLLSLAFTTLVHAFEARAPEDEIVYFLLVDRFENGDPSNDRGGLKGDRLTTGSVAARL